MSPTFQTRRWRASAATSYIGMHVGILIVTVTLPLTFLGMGQTSDLNVLALHCFSLKKIQYWMLGIGGLTALCEVFAIVAAMKAHKPARIASAMLLCVICSLTVSLLVWGVFDEDGRKSYLKETWNSMADDTKYFLQSYFSCCGFQNSSDWTARVRPLDGSCYAIAEEKITWYEGCYERITAPYLDAITVTNAANQSVPVADGKVNPFHVSFYVSLCTLILAQVSSIGMIVSAILFAGERYGFQSEQIGFSNVYAEPDPDTIECRNGSGGMHSEQSKHNGHLEQGSASQYTFNQGDPAKEQWYAVMGDKVTKAYGDVFYWIGCQVGKHPKMTICYSFLAVLSLCTGLLQRYSIDSTNVLEFLSEGDQVRKEHNIVVDTFILEGRTQSIMLASESNAISANNLVTALTIDQRVKELTTPLGFNFSTLCMKVGDTCRQRSLLELWRFNDTLIQNLSDSDILAEINKNPITSPIFGDEIDITHILGGIERDSSNQTTATKSHLLSYVTTSNEENWEDLFIEVGRKWYNGVEVYVQAESSRVQEVSGETLRELPSLFGGICLIFVYIILMTGKFSLLEHRTYVALMGVAAAGLAMGAGIGLTPCFGLIWTGLHMIVPFIVIGIGVDDMFVLLQEWDNVEKDENWKEKSLEEKSGRVLRSAGVSITVTSLTDLVAFSVAATSHLGGLASFSIYVAISIILLFFLECTFFMACVVLDQQRKSERYDACFLCLHKHKKDYKSGKCADREILQTVFEDVIGRLVTMLPIGAIVIMTTLSFSSFMAWGFYKLRIAFDANWYLPSGSYFLDFSQKLEQFYNVGSDADVYVIDGDIYSEREKLHSLYENLKANVNLDSAYLLSWFENFVTWVNETKGNTDVYSNSAFTNATTFYSEVHEFLSTAGTSFISDVVFNDGTIAGSKFHIRHVLTSDPTDNVEVVDSVRANCEAANFSSANVFPYGSYYLFYQIDRIILREVYRNLGLTLACVFFMVLPTLASLQMGFWVTFCVVLTTVDVAGTMYFAGLTIEFGTTITLLLSIGLAVDYAVHVGHKFLVLQGSRELRARVAVGQMGVAVFNGGFSTFLALVFLGGSQVYFYKVFFTVFSCVIGYGLWNGLVFLPCVLSICGPSPHSTATVAQLSSERPSGRNHNEI